MYYHIILNKAFNGMDNQELLTKYNADLCLLKKEYNAVNKQIRTRNTANENADDLIAANYYNQTSIDELEVQIAELKLSMNL